MDDREASISSHDPGGRVGADAAPIASLLREGPVAVYCDNAQQVSEGFAIALRAMGIAEDVGLSATNPNREDN